MMNLTIMKLNLALKVEAPPKPIVESSASEKKSYEDWEYSNNCCLMIMENHIEDSIYESIPKTKNVKEFLDVIGKKYTKFSKIEKNKLLNTLHSTFYEGTSGVRGHIDKILACYNNIKTIGMEFDSDCVVWLIMGALPSQFDSIGSSYKAQNKQWTIEEMIVILAKEEEDMKKGRSTSIYVVTTQGNGGQERKYPYNTSSNEKRYVKKHNTSVKGNDKNVSSTSNAPKNEGFKGKCYYCHKFGHKKIDCKKLKVVQENKGDDKQKSN